ncbi:MAG TPA: AAA family ATPase [Kiritimatiellia bacterium]|jgi:predicted ATPase|nr:AAA family ATPase [Kiritimatiellia bacterium]
MLSKIRMEGFKAYSTPVEVDLRLMTVFCGINGCGKSTILQALMALKQCFVGPASPKVVRLNG